MIKDSAKKIKAFIIIIKTKRLSLNESYRASFRMKPNPMNQLVETQTVLYY